MHLNLKKTEQSFNAHISSLVRILLLNKPMTLLLKDKTPTEILAQSAGAAEYTDYISAEG